MAADTLSSVEFGTGGASNLAAFVDMTLGQVVDALGSDDPVFFKDTQQAREALRLFTQETSSSLAGGTLFFNELADGCPLVLLGGQAA